MNKVTMMASIGNIKNIFKNDDIDAIEAINECLYFQEQYYESLLNAYKQRLFNQQPNEDENTCTILGVTLPINLGEFSSLSPLEKVAVFTQIKQQ